MRTAIAALPQLPPEEREAAIVAIARRIIREGVSADEFDQLQAVLEQLNHPAAAEMTRRPA